MLTSLSFTFLAFRPQLTLIAPELFKENLEDERKLLAQCLFQISYTKRLTAEEVMALARVIQNYDTQTVADHQTRVVLLVSLLTSLEPSHYGHSQANRAVNLRENDAFTRDFEALLLAAWRNALTQNAVSLAWGTFLQRQVPLLSPFRKSHLLIIIINTLLCQIPQRSQAR